MMLLLEVLPVLLADVGDTLLEDPLGLLDVARLLERPGPADIELGASLADVALVHELKDLDGVNSIEYQQALQQSAYGRICSDRDTL